jgi:hypothetical protein
VLPCGELSEKRGRKGDHEFDKSGGGENLWLSNRTSSSLICEMGERHYLNPATTAFGTEYGKQRLVSFISQTLNSCEGTS